jgi:hypothetical protein
VLCRPWVVKARDAHDDDDAARVREADGPREVGNARLDVGVRLDGDGDLRRIVHRALVVLAVEDHGVELARRELVERVHPANLRVRTRDEHAAEDLVLGPTEPVFFRGLVRLGQEVRNLDGAPRLEALVLFGDDRRELLRVVDVRHIEVRLRDRLRGIAGFDSVHDVRRSSGRRRDHLSALGKALREPRGKRPAPCFTPRVGRSTRRRFAGFGLERRIDPRVERRRRVPTAADEEHRHSDARARPHHPSFSRSAEESCSAIKR